MSAMNFSPLDKIYVTWETIRQSAKEPAPAWHELSPAMREAIIRMWAAGEKHVLEQIDERRKV